MSKYAVLSELNWYLSNLLLLNTKVGDFVLIAYRVQREVVLQCDSLEAGSLFST